MRTHQNNLEYGEIESVLEEVAKDKHGIVVSHNPNVDFGTVDPSRGREGIKLDLMIQTTVPTSNIYLREVKLSSEATRRRSP